ncbi:MAG: dTDP-4-dehydrorhamnose 3,5-epimerase [Isosphaeraceae bacterium]|nr:dTDP-4-dehydrorhamnose 3,5-epimerase [Isosphaeraceae bacterium]
MNRIETELPGVFLLEPRLFRDDRGYLTELFNSNRYADVGLDAPFVQDNLSRSRRGVLRGLHYQWPSAQGKLVTVIEGEVFDVAVDIRRGSPHFGKWVGATLSGENHRQIYIPPGFAHGFVVTGDSALVLYKCTALYNPGDEGSVLWNDPAIGIDWPTGDHILAAKDLAAPRLEAIAADRLPRFD